MIDKYCYFVGQLWEREERLDHNTTVKELMSDTEPGKETLEDTAANINVVLITQHSSSKTTWRGPFQHGTSAAARHNSSPSSEQLQPSDSHIVSSFDNVLQIP